MLVIVVTTWLTFKGECLFSYFYGYDLRRLSYSPWAHLENEGNNAIFNVTTKDLSGTHNLLFDLQPWNIPSNPESSPLYSGIYASNLNGYSVFTSPS